MPRNTELPCPGNCGSTMTLKEDESAGGIKRWSHTGFHDVNCIMNHYEPLSQQAMMGHRRGDWKVNLEVDGGIERVERPKPPVSQEQFKDNVINVDFKNKKRI